MKPRVLVHGADNFMGRHMMTALTNSGTHEAVAASMADTLKLRQELPRIDAIIHCSVGSAAAVRHGATALHEILASSGGSPPIGRLRTVHVGSMTVYGAAVGVVTEDSTPQPSLNPYACAQLQAESTALQRDNTVILRSGVEYGPDCPHWSGRIARLLRAGRLGDLGAAGDGICNLVYIADLAAVALQVLQQPDIEKQVFNVALNDKPTWNDYFIEFAQALGAVPVKRISQRRLSVEAKLLAVPLKLAELAAAKVGLRRLSPPPAIPPSLLRGFTHDIVLSTVKAERVLGAQWTPRDRALAITAAHYRFTDL